MLLPLIITAQTTLNYFVPYNTQGDNLIHVTTADLNGIGVKDFVVAMSLEGKIIAFQHSKEVTQPDSDHRLWEYTNLPSLGIRIFAENVIAESKGDEILLPGTDGHLRLLSSTGQLLFDKEISSGALYTATVGKNKNGETIVMTSGVDGLIYFLNTQLDIIKTVRPKTDKTNNRAGVIRHLVAGDFNGDGSDDVAAFINRKSFQGNCFIDLINLSTFQRPEYWNQSSDYIIDDTTPGLGFTDKQLAFAYDIDNDGDEELVAHWGVYYPENGTGSREFSTMINEKEKLTLKKYENFAQQYLKEEHGFKDRDKEKLTNTGKYLMQHGLPGDFNNDGHQQLFMLYGDDLFLSTYSKENAAFSITDYTWANTEYHFSGIARLEDRNGGYDKVVLSGPVNGDDHYYIVDVSTEDWKTEARKINNRGTFKEVNDNLDQLTNDLLSAPSEIDENRDPIWFVSSSFGGYLSWEMTDANIAERVDNTYEQMQEWYQKIGGQNNIRLAVTLPTEIYGETTQGGHPNITAEGIIKYCKALAQKGVYFCVIIGHGNHLYMNPKTFADIYEASIVDGECYMMARTKELKSNDYFDLYTPHLDAVLEKSDLLDVPPPMVMLCAKGAIFSTFTQNQGDEYYPKYKDVLVPGVENSNVGVQDLSIQERVGLWMHGDVKNWGCNIIGDNLSANRVAEWGGMRNAHVVLRHLLAQYSLGAKVFRITSVTNKDNPLFIRGDVTGKDKEWSQPFQKGVLNFLKIVEKGVYPHPQNPEEMRGISPLSVAIYDRTNRLNNMSYKHDHDLYTPDNKEYVLSKLACWDAYTDISENDMTSYISGAKRRWDNLLPQSKGGFVTVVPHTKKEEVEDNKWCNIAYQTDGNDWKDYSLAEGRGKILQDLEKQRQFLDFYVDGECFWQTARKKEDPLTYYLMIMGNSFLTPKESIVSIRAGSTIAGVCEIKDQLTGTSIGSLYTTESDIPVKIKKGVPRFFKITLTQKTNDPVPENGDFEAQLLNWNYEKNVMATNEVYYGNYAAELTDNTSMYQWREVTPETTYTLSAFAKINDFSDGKAIFSVLSEENNTLGSCLVEETNYTAYRIKFKVPKDVHRLKLDYTNQIISKGKAYLDEVILKPTAYIINSEFNKEFLGWSTEGQVEIDRNEIIENNWLKISGKGEVHQWIKTLPSTTYKISMTTQKNQLTAQPHFYVNNASGQSYIEEVITEGDLQRSTFTFTTNEEEEDTKIGFLQDEDNAISFWVDQLSLIVVENDDVTSIQSDDLQLKIYPNPASDVVTIKAEHMKGIKKVSILNIVGQPVLSTSFENSLQLPVSSLQRGTYIVDISDENGQRSIEKLIIK